MPAIFPAGTQTLATLRSLAARGDVMATSLMALMNNTYYASLTAGVEATNAITVSGQIKDQDGNNVTGIKNVLITSKPIAGAGTITDGGNGAVVAGSASVVCWMTTTAAGAFQFTVTNVIAEQNLIKVEIDNGTTEILILTFA